VAIAFAAFKKRVIFSSIVHHEGRVGALLPTKKAYIVSCRKIKRFYDRIFVGVTQKLEKEAAATKNWFILCQNINTKTNYYKNCRYSRLRRHLLLNNSMIGLTLLEMEVGDNAAKLRSESLFHVMRN